MTFRVFSWIVGAVAVALMLVDRDRQWLYLAAEIGLLVGAILGSVGAVK